MITTRGPLRGLSALLLLLSPGVGGQLLARLHPCPAAVFAPAAAPGTGWGGGGDGRASARASDLARRCPGETPPADGHDHSPGTCDCLGSCHTPALVAAPQAQIVVVATEAQPAVRASWPAIESTVPARPVDRLPPTTAPPSA
ncbi:MAG: hypothetical protein IPG05_12155 [Gemmatimonadetes bacterium]|nr:hypothetical protein [Gemmatimonadota bacterium]